MTTRKDFKRLVRGRMTKTGESYTAARARLLEKKKAAAAPAAAVKPPPAAADAALAELAGMADASVEAKTGKRWAAWVRALDAAGAGGWSHTQIARHLREAFGVSGWWSQMVAVGYQRIKGMRAVGQRSDGKGYSISKSKSFPVPVARLYRQLADRRSRARWLPGIDLTVRTAIAGKSMRITWPDGTWVQAVFVARDTAKSTLYIDHTRLPDRAAADRARAFWADRLAALAALLA